MCEYMQDYCKSATLTFKKRLYFACDILSTCSESLFQVILKSFNVIENHCPETNVLHINII